MPSWFSFILFFWAHLSLDHRVSLFTEVQRTPAHWNQGGAGGERHSSGQRFVHGGEHRPWMLLAHQLGGGKFLLITVPTVPPTLGCRVPNQSKLWSCPNFPFPIFVGVCLVNPVYKSSVCVSSCPIKKDRLVRNPAFCTLPLTLGGCALCSSQDLINLMLHERTTCSDSANLS